MKKKKKKEKSLQKNRLAERQNQMERVRPYQEPRPSSSGLDRLSRIEKHGEKNTKKKVETRKTLQLQPHTMNFRNVDIFQK